MDAIEAYMNDVRAVKDALLTRDEEMDLAKTIEAGVIAGAVLDGIDPHAAMPKRLAFDQVRDIMSRIVDRESSPVAEVLAVPSSKRDVLMEYKSQGERARTRFITMNTRMVTRFVLPWRNHGLSYPDLIQEGNIGLIHAVDKYDWRHGYRFSSYAFHWINQYVERAIDNTARSVRLPVHVEVSSRAVANAMTTYDGDISDVAASLGITEKRVREIIHYDSVTRATSLDKPINESGVTIGDVHDDGMDSFEDDVIDDNDIMMAVDGLSEDDRLLVMEVRRTGSVSSAAHALGMRVGDAHDAMSVISERIFS